MNTFTSFLLSFLVYKINHSCLPCRALREPARTVLGPRRCSVNDNSDLARQSPEHRRWAKFSRIKYDKAELNSFRGRASYRLLKFHGEDTISSALGLERQFTILFSFMTLSWPSDDRFKLILSPKPKRIGDLVWDLQTVLLDILSPTQMSKHQPLPG